VSALVERVEESHVVRGESEIGDVGSAAHQHGAVETPPSRQRAMGLELDGGHIVEAEVAQLGVARSFVLS
jgi:predicted carbohydrate-binding protein with CBM5 and CBM33 domain